MSSCLTMKIEFITHLLFSQVSVDADSDHLSTPLGDWKELSVNHQIQW